MKPPFLRTEYNYDMNKASDESGLKCTDPTRAKQSFAEEVDINTIVRRFNLTGQLPTNVRVPTYGEFQEVSDFHTAMNIVAEAEQAFMYMPADIRARFGNDPGTFLEFVSDDKNYETAKQWGIVNAPPPPLDPTPRQATPLPEKAKSAPKGSSKATQGDDE